MGRQYSQLSMCLVKRRRRRMACRKKYQTKYRVLLLCALSDIYISFYVYMHIYVKSIDLARASRDFSRECIRNQVLVEPRVRNKLLCRWYRAGRHNLRERKKLCMCKTRNSRGPVPPPPPSVSRGTAGAGGGGEECIFSEIAVDRHRPPVGRKLCDVIKSRLLRQCAPC